MYKQLRLMLPALLCLILWQPKAEGALATYMVEFGIDDGMGGFTPISGPVAVGTMIDWRITLDFDPEGATNLGIAAANVDLTETIDGGPGGEILSPGTIDAAFAGYDASDGGFPVGNVLFEIGASQFMQDGSEVGGGPDPPLLTLATGSYTLTTIGTHMLTLSAGSENRYFDESPQTLSGAPEFAPTFVNDQIVVLASVPEPASMAMMGVAALGALGLRRRKNRHRQQSA